MMYVPALVEIVSMWTTKRMDHQAQRTRVQHEQAVPAPVPHLCCMERTHQVADASGNWHSRHLCMFGKDLQNLFAALVLALDLLGGAEC